MFDFVMVWATILLVLAVNIQSECLLCVLIRKKSRLRFHAMKYKNLLPFNATIEISLTNVKNKKNYFD